MVPEGGHTFVVGQLRHPSGILSIDFAEVHEDRLARTSASRPMLPYRPPNISKDEERERDISLLEYYGELE